MKREITYCDNCGEAGTMKPHEVFVCVDCMNEGIFRMEEDALALVEELEARNICAVAHRLGENRVGQKNWFVFVEGIYLSGAKKK